MAQNTPGWKNGWGGYRSSDGEYHETLWEAEAASKRYNEQVKTNKLLKEQNEIEKEKIRLQKQKEIEEEDQARLDNINNELYKEKLRYDNFINQKKLEIKLEETRANKIKELRAQLELEKDECHNNYNKIKQDISNYNKVLDILNDKSISEEDRINNAKEEIIDIDLEFSGEILGRYELKINDYIILINGQIKKLNNKLKDELNQLNYKKSLLVIVNSDYATKDKYQKYKTYNKNLDYEKLYYDLLKEDKDTKENNEIKIKKQKEEQLKKLKDETEYNNNKNELQNVENSINEIETNIKAIEYQFNFDNEIRSKIYKSNKNIYYIIYGIILLLVSLLVVFAYDIKTFTIIIGLIIGVGILGYKYINKKLLDLKNNYNFVNEQKREKFNKEIKQEQEKINKKIKIKESLKSFINKYEKSKSQNLFIEDYGIVEYGDYSLNKNIDLEEIEYYAKIIYENNKYCIENENFDLIEYNDYNIDKVKNK